MEFHLIFYVLLAFALQATALTLNSMVKEGGKNHRNVEFLKKWFELLLFLSFLVLCAFFADALFNVKVTIS